MTDSLDLYPDDKVETAFRDAVNQFYSELDEWSRTIPTESRADGYKPNKLLVATGYKDSLNMRVPSYLELAQDGKFLALIATADAYGDVEIEVFLAEVPEQGVADVEYGNNRSPDREYLHSETVDADGADNTELVEKVLKQMSNLAEKYQSKNFS